MRIRTGRSRQYTSPAEQRRLLLLVLLIGGAVILITSAAPWLPRPAQLLRFLQESPSAPLLRLGQSDGSAIDTRLLPHSPGQSSEPFVWQSEYEKRPVSEPDQSASSSPGGPARPQSSAAEAASPGPAFTTSGIDFSVVRDDQPFRSAESGPWFAVLARLNKADERAIAAASQGWVTFSQLYRRSQERRGQVVTVKGQVVQAARMKAPKNGAAITEYYQLWLRPADENNPLVIYALSVPPGFPLGDRPDESVEVHGVFFKRWAYQAQDALRAAPVLLAKEIHWQRSRPAGDPAAVPDPLLAVLLAAFFAGGFVWYVYAKTRPQSQTDLPGESSRGASRSPVRKA
ncbi:MAG: hypothetical protein GYA33_05320 [Thermogutta sp.]|nr:hypothetical protein [Thermogutta sp.]